MGNDLPPASAQTAMDLAGELAELLLNSAPVLAASERYQKFLESLESAQSLLPQEEYSRLVVSIRLSWQTLLESPLELPPELEP